ncbi:cation transporter [Thermodesulfobacteriota bacterium]
MRFLKKLFSNKMVIFGILFMMVITAAVSFGYRRSKDAVKAPIVTEVTGTQNTTKGSIAATGNTAGRGSVEPSDDLSKLVLNVSNMSCSGCISTIKSSIAGFQEIKETLVDLGGGKVEIYYEGEKIKNVSPIAEAITASGYPAKVLKVLSPEDVRKERALADSRSKYYVASVSGWDIARADFDAELVVAKKKYQKIYGEKLFVSQQGETLLGNLKGQIISKLIDEGIMMQEIVKSGFKVDREILESSLQDLLQEHSKEPDEFKESLSAAGYDYDYFKRKFEIKILINKYINGRILADASNDFEKQNLFNTWFSNAKTLAEIVYYDRNLELLVQSLSASSGCGGAS